MVRWFVRFSAAVLVGALLVWFWNRYNEDLLEEEVEEEIPLEFEVSAQDVLAPGSLDGNGAVSDAAPIATSVLADAPNESVAPAEAPADEPKTAKPAAVPSAEVATKGPAETPVEAVTDAEDTTEKQKMLLNSPAPTPAGAGDNVMAIRGIGPKYGEKLAEMGITTFGALLGTPIDTLAVAFPRVTETELHSWMEQARELAAQHREPA